MDNSIIYSPSNYVSMPWKNGLGETIELLKLTLPQEPDFCWRISMADVVENGPFSSFQGYDRTLVLLQGKGINLTTGDQQTLRLSKPLDRAQFRGDDKTLATLQDGPITDFNIITNRISCRADVEVGQGNGRDRDDEANCDELLIFSINTEIEIALENQSSIRLPGRHLFHAQNLNQRLLFKGSAKFIMVKIDYLP